MHISGDFRKVSHLDIFFFYWILLVILNSELSVGCSWARACDVTRT